MNMFKKVKKHIPFTLKALIVVPIVFFGVPALLFEAMEYFQPKNITIGKGIGGVHIKAPSGMRLHSGWVDDIVQKPYYSLFLKNTYNYPFPKRRASLLFMPINDNARAKILDILILQDTNLTKDKSGEAFKDYMKILKLDRKNQQGMYYTNPVKIEGERCFGWSVDYKFNKAEKRIFSQADIFHEPTSSWVSITSDNKAIVSEVSDRFCKVYR